MANLKPKWLGFVHDSYAIFTLFKYFVDACVYNLRAALSKQIHHHLCNFYSFFIATLLKYKKKKIDWSRQKHGSIFV